MYRKYVYTASPSLVFVVFSLHRGHVPLQNPTALEVRAGLDVTLVGMELGCSGAQSRRQRPRAPNGESCWHSSFEVAALWLISSPPPTMTAQLAHSLQTSEPWGRALCTGNNWGYK